MEPQEQNDPVWKLLSHAQKSEPTVFFARNVIREIRLLESSQNRFWNRLSQWLSSRVLIVLSESPNPIGNDSGIAHVPVIEGASEAFDPASEMASIEYLGQLMAVADPGQLDDAALADLFY
jgi:hypothetical protein